MVMEVLKGTAVGVRYTVHVSGDKDGISTQHHTLFKIGKMTVMFTSPGPAVIGEGDQLIVAGRLKGQMLMAQAYENRTAGISGDSGMWANFAAMIFFLLPGSISLAVGLLWPVIPWIPPIDILRWVLIGAGAAFCALGLYCWFRYRHIRDAIRMVKGS